MFSKHPFNSNHRGGGHLLIFLGSLLIFVLLIDLGIAIAKKKNESLFDHSIKPHQKVDCSACHSQGSQSAQQRPGSTTHLLCSGSGCHEIFTSKKNQKSEKVCLACHTQAEPWKIDQKDLLPYPPPSKNSRSYCTAFPHKTHLKLSDKPVNDQCVSCHQSKDDKPSHATCSKCHKEPKKQDGKMRRRTRVHTFDRCAKCHHPRKKRSSQLCTKWSVSRQFRVGRAFDHEQHSIDIKASSPTPLSCATCHPNVAKHDGFKSGKGKTWIKLLASKAMARTCGRCHNGRVSNPKNGKKVFSVKNSNTCGKCHLNLRFTAKQKSKGHGRSAW